VANATSRVLYPGEKRTGTNFTGGGVGAWAGPDGSEVTYFQLHSSPGPCRM